MQISGGVVCNLASYSSVVPSSVNEFWPKTPKAIAHEACIPKVMLLGTEQSSDSSSCYRVAKSKKKLLQHGADQSS